MNSNYKAVIGLEVHAQLLTASKMFSAEAAEFGGHPNTYVSAISLGHPGTLPSINSRCVEFAIKMGLATGCAINRHNIFARKNYFYGDLPKGYQISQHHGPICAQGSIPLVLPDGREKTVRIHRIHLEEDSGKSLHDQDIFHSLIDLNRAGIGLIEIVSEADIESPEEASAYVAEVRKLVRYLDICDGNMEEGSLRCDANISVMKRDATEWGTKVEVKNMNSITHVGKAVAYEISRQIELIEGGGKVVQQTRTWDAANTRTIPMRDKESSDDYRYFPEPDLQPVVVTDELLERLRLELPELPQALYKRYTTEYGLIHFDAITIIEDKKLSAFFDELTEISDAKTASTWVLGPVKAWLNENAYTMADFPLSPLSIAAIASLVGSSKVSFSMAKDKLFPALIADPSAAPEAKAAQLDILLEDKKDEVDAFVTELMAKFPDKVAAYRNGQKGMLGFFMGEIMKFTKGKANPKEVSPQVQKRLEAED